jgi:hypothetical protein
MKESFAVTILGDTAVSCVGGGCGSMRWSEEELKRLELAVVGALRLAGLLGVIFTLAASCFTKPHQSTARASA